MRCNSCHEDSKSAARQAQKSMSEYHQKSPSRAWSLSRSCRRLVLYQIYVFAAYAQSFDWLGVES